MRDIDIRYFLLPRPTHETRLIVRFIRDVFVENYDPTIEGQLDANHTSGSFIISSGEVEEYRREITVDGQLDSVGLLHLSMSGRKADKNRYYVHLPFISHVYDNPLSWRFWILQGPNNSPLSTKYISRLSTAYLCL